MANKKRHGWLKFARLSEFTIEQLLHWPTDNFLAKQRLRIVPQDGIVEHTKCIGLRLAPQTVYLGGQVSICNLYGSIILHEYILPKYLTFDWRIALIRKQNTKKSEDRPEKLLSFCEAEQKIKRILSQSIVFGFQILAALRYLNIYCCHGIDVARLPIFGCVGNTSEFGLMEYFFGINQYKEKNIDSARAAILLFRTFEAEYTEFYLTDSEKIDLMELVVIDDESDLD